MKQAESDVKNQQRCPVCKRVVGCDYRGRKIKCGCQIDTRLTGSQKPRDAWGTDNMRQDMGQ